MNDEKTAQDYKISGGSVLHLCSRSGVEVGCNMCGRHCIVLMDMWKTLYCIVA